MSTKKVNDVVILDILQQAGYQASVSSQGRYMAGVTRLLGGDFVLDILQREDVQTLFTNAQIRKGRIYTLNELRQVTKPDDVTQFNQVMRQLVHQNAFMRGYMLQCLTCDLEAWYRLGDVDELTVCQGCGDLIHLPLELDFSYQPNRLLQEALKSGALTVLLTLFNWLWESPVLHSETGIVVRGHGIQTDIDLIAKREDKLIMAECKDSFATDDDSIDTIIAQCSMSKSIADKVGAELVFATLLDEKIPTKLTQYFHEQHIAIMSRDKLMKV